MGPKALSIFFHDFKKAWLILSMLGIAGSLVLTFFSLLLGFVELNKQAKTMTGNQVKVCFENSNMKGKNSPF